MTKTRLDRGRDHLGPVPPHLGDPMTADFPDTSPFIRRILTSYRDEDASELRRAVSDAFNAGIPVEHLITVLAGNLINALKASGRDFILLPEETPHE